MTLGLFKNRKKLKMFTVLRENPYSTKINREISEFSYINQNFFG